MEVDLLAELALFDAGGEPDNVRLPVEDGQAVCGLELEAAYVSGVRNKNSNAVREQMHFFSIAPSGGPLTFHGCMLMDLIKTTIFLRVKMYVPLICK